MNKLWKYLQSRITNMERRKPDLPFLHETIDFDIFPIEKFEAWKDGPTHTLMQQRLRQAYFNHNTSGNDDAAFEFFTTPASNGFALFQRKNYRLKLWDYRFLQHDIAVRLKDKGYILKLSDVRSQAKGNGIERIYRYYLKPSAKLRQGPKAVQLYGNVSLEVILRDDAPYMFKCLANSYKDQHFIPPHPFGELVSLVVA